MAGNYATRVMTENDQVILDIDDNIFYAAVLELDWQGDPPSSTGAIIYESLCADQNWQLFAAGIYNLAYPYERANALQSGEIIRKIRITTAGMDPGSRVVVRFLCRFDNPFPSRNLLEGARGAFRTTVQSLNYRDDLVARGYGFYTGVEYTDESGGDPIPRNGGVRYAEFTAPPNHYVALSYREIITNRERLFYRAYVGYGSVTLGDESTVFNLRTNGQIESQSSLFKVTNTPDLSGATRVINMPVFGEELSGKKTNGNLASDSVFRFIEPGQKILLEFKNDSNRDSYLYAEFTWSEIPEEIVVDGGFG